MASYTVPLTRKISHHRTDPVYVVADEFVDTGIEYVISIRRAPATITDNERDETRRYLRKKLRSQGLLRTFNAAFRRRWARNPAH